MMSQTRESAVRRCLAMMKRDDYRRVKGMDRAAMTAYLDRIYQRGYEAGLAAGSGKLTVPAKPQASGEEPKG